jgi:hypothetical protein
MFTQLPGPEEEIATQHSVTVGDAQNYIARSRNCFPASISKKFGQFWKKLANLTKTSIQHTHEGSVRNQFKLFFVSESVSVLLNQELLYKIFSGPFSATFGKNSTRIRSQILPANFIFPRPLLSFLAKISATWQHCSEHAPVGDGMGWGSSQGRQNL